MHLAIFERRRRRRQNNERGGKRHPPRAISHPILSIGSVMMLATVQCCLLYVCPPKTPLLLLPLQDLCLCCASGERMSVLIASCVKLIAHRRLRPTVVYIFAKTVQDRRTTNERGRGVQVECKRNILRLRSPPSCSARRSERVGGRRSGRRL